MEEIKYINQLDDQYLIDYANMILFKQKDYEEFIVKHHKSYIVLPCVRDCKYVKFKDFEYVGFNSCKPIFSNIEESSEWVIYVYEKLPDELKELYLRDFKDWKNKNTNLINKQNSYDELEK